HVNNTDRIDTTYPATGCQSLLKPGEVTAWRSSSSTSPAARDRGERAPRHGSLLETLPDRERGSAPSLRSSASASSGTRCPSARSSSTAHARQVVALVGTCVSSSRPAPRDAGD